MGRALWKNKFEASANGCAVIISNKGGLPETITNGIILKKLTVNEIYQKIRIFNINSKQRIIYKNYPIKIFICHINLFSKNQIDKVRKF